MIIHNYLSILYIKLFAYIASIQKVPGQQSSVDIVSIIIPAYNEEKIIYDKLVNIKECIENIKIPATIEVLVGSDGSEDATCRIVESFIHENALINWQLFAFANSGKGRTINKLVAQSRGSIIISTDADVLLGKDSFAKVIDAFHKDRQLGCMSCVPVFSKDVESQNIYWNQDISFRRSESDLGMLIVVTGWLYGFRKEVFREIPQGVMADDLWIPLTILLQGYRCVQNENLKVLSEKTDEHTEIVRRKRVITGGMDVVKRLSGALSRKPLLLFLVFSHKINRWLLPFWVSLIVVSTIFLHSSFVFLYGIVGLLMIFLLKPRRFFSYLYALYSPVFSFVELLTSSDHSKWEHLRK